MGKNKGQTKPYSSILGLENSCIALWPPAALRAPPRMFCAVSTFLFHLHWNKPTAECDFFSLLKFCDYSLDLQSRWWLFSLLWPCELSQSLDRVRYPKIPARDTAALGWLFGIMKGRRSEFCLRLGALEIKLILMGVVGVQHLWKWNFQHFAAGKELALCSQCCFFPNETYGVTEVITLEVKRCFWYFSASFVAKRSDGEAKFISLSSIG